MKSRLTKKGYEIDKKTITLDKLNEIKEDLTVKPYIPGDDNVKSFNVYSETKTNIIIPRFYGINKFGQPIKNLLVGTDSNYKFNGNLRENQVKIMDKTVPYLVQNKGGILSVGCAAGKCMSKGTKVLMYSGILKNIEDIQIGELLMGDDSTPRKVLSLARGTEEMFDIIPTKGEKYTVNRSHILSLKWESHISKSINGTRYKKGDIVDISVDDYLKLSPTYHDMATPLKGYRVPINFPKKKVLMDPYMIGYWLGDGDSNKSLITIAEKEVLDYFTKNIKKYNLNLKQKNDTVRCRGNNHYKITCGTYNTESKIWSKDNCTNNKFTQTLKHYNLLNNKHIPHDYKCNSREIRLALLAGIIDSDGTLSKPGEKGLDICLKSEKLMDDIIYLCRSLGYVCYKTCTKASGESKDETYYRTCIEGINKYEIPVLLERKKPISKSLVKNSLNYGITVKSIGIGEYYGFEIDGNRRFVLGDFTVTHNTVMALYLGSALKAKTLVLVHKSFLLEQWITRAKQFTNAKIGILKQNKIPDPDCDIVIGMIQSISMKDYDSKIFDGFKLLIVDECIAKNQYIITDSGPIKIDELYNKWVKKEKLPLIKSYNQKEDKFEYKKMTHAWEKKINEKLLKITIDNNKIICTINHKFLTNNGYIEARNLSVGTIVYMNDNNQVIHTKINKIDYCDQEIKYVYDIEVQDNHNFIVCGNCPVSNGIIAHNCHHYAAPVFSRGLQKCGAPYIFALSATPYRQDKLTKILFWNLGNIYYRQKTKSNKQVICKIIRFKSNDKLFVEKRQWRGGKMTPSHPKMINNFVEIKSRNKQLINILEELRKFPERKVLILSGRKEHLKYLKDSIDRNIENDIESGLLEPLEYRTYYYMGGMKDSQRKEAEDYGDMIFGTYDMAHEGLDIDKLNTIVLATPKKDIVQSVGRIMRKILKVGDVRPLIIDFRDEISIYKNQGEVRLKQYVKGNYKIENYYLKDDNILTLDDFLKEEYKMDKKEIAQYKKENPDRVYVPKYENIFDLQKVKEEDEKEENNEIIEVDPNEEDVFSDDESDISGDSDDSDDEDNNKPTYKKTNFNEYMF